MANVDRTHLWFLCLSVIFMLTTVTTNAAPTSERKGKLFFDYVPQHEDNFASVYDNEISRTAPAQERPFNSPIYYIRLPPIPYTFVPGLGYMSHPTHPPSLLNLPLNFVSNGKPSTVYRWSGALDHFTTPPPPPKQHINAIPDSVTHHIPGKFQFNGKPSNLYILRDSYNSLYDDALQNLYP